MLTNLLLCRNVQVTLGILAALIEKSPKEAALIAPYTLKILDQILRSNDITMIESSLPTFEAFCEHNDATSLFGDKQYAGEYESVIKQYAQFASTRSSPSTPSKTPLSRPMQVRWRNAGLTAIKCVSAADNLSSLTGRQMDVVIPRILENLWTDNESFIDVLQERLRLEEKEDEEKVVRRRNSIAIADAADAAGNQPVALPDTTADADMLAEEDTGVLAMQCLKSIFIAPNRSQIYSATVALLKFVSERVKQGESVIVDDEKGIATSGWAIRIFNIVSRWAPVQDRYVILLVALDTLIRTPVKDSTLEQHLTFSALIGSLLRSDLSLVGLSVMDVLLGLIRQLRKLFQLQSEMSRSGSGSGNGTKDASQAEPEDAGQRLQLRQRLEQCIGDLATHVYYADQIWDMITAIVVRLKPSRKSSAGGTAPKENGEQAPEDDSHPDLTDSQISQIDSFFSYPAGRASALRIVKGIFLVANPQTKIAGNVDLSRNRVPIQVWEGTHWLLRDADGNVRKAYADALGTWLDRETTRADLYAEDFSADAKNGRDPSSARRTISNISTGEHHYHPRQSSFLPLLHLAIFDNALQYVDYDSDMVLLHTLLAKLAFKLGVNAVRCGLPMIYRLQEEIQEVEQPIHKVRISALCHGYFWAICDKFDLGSSVGGRAIQNEIARRRSKGFWVNGIIVPTLSVDELALPGRPGSAPSWDVAALEREELLPFDDRTSLVQGIAGSYEDGVHSPPGSPALAPARNTPQNSAILSKHAELPDAVREEMLAEWSRENVLTTVAAQGKAESMNGSKSGTTGARTANRLALHAAGVNGNGQSPYGSLHNLRPLSAHVPADRERFGSLSKLRKTSVQSGTSPTPSLSGKNGIASVDQLKMILAGNVSPKTIGIPGTAGSDDSGESMVSYDYTHSELSFNPPGPGEQGATTTGEILNRTISASSRGGATSQTDADGEDEDDVPPVPPLPKLSALTGKNALLTSGSVRSKRTVSGQSSLRQDGQKSMDLQELLRGIDSTSGEGSLGNVSRPPY